MCLAAAALVAVVAVVALAAVSLTATPDSITFQDKDVGTPATAPEESTIKNVSGSMATINSVSDDSADFDVYTQVGDCDTGTVLNPDDTCLVHATFQPQSDGSKSGTLTVDSDQGPATISLSGEATVRGLTGDPIDFGDLNVGESSFTQQSTVTNTGSESIDLDTDPTIDGPDATQFSFDTAQPGDCDSTDTLGPGDTCLLRVIFHPTSPTGMKTAHVTLTATDAADSTVGLSGNATQPVLARDTDLSFGNQDIDDGPTAVQVSTVTNNGDGPATISGVTLGGTNPNQFAFDTPAMGDCQNGTVLNPTESCFVRVAFDPTTTGMKAATADVASDAAPLSIALDGSGIQTALNPDDSDLDFGPQNIASGPTTTQTSTITNSGTQTVDVSGVAKGGNDPGQFVLLAGQAQDCSTKASISAGQTCQVRVQFDPSTVGSKSATVTIPGRPEATVSLTGSGTGAQLSADPTSLSFGSRDVDDGPGSTQDVTVENTGTVPVTLTGIDVTGDFQQTTAPDPSCATNTLNVGQQCVLRVRFDPSATGARSGNATVHSNAADLVVPLGGTGIDTLLSRSPATLAFGNRDIDDGPTVAQTATITNAGTEPVTLTGITLGGDGDQFERLAPQGGDCTTTTTLTHPNDSCTIQVRFDPTTVDAKNATLTVQSNAPNVSVSLTGTGTQTALAVDSGASLAFGDKDIDDGPTAEQVSTIKNTGTESVTITSIGSSGDSADFERRTGNGDDCLSAIATLGAGVSCKVRVRFDPGSTGDKAATLTVHSNAADVSAGLTGRGIQTSVSGAPATLAFGGRDIDDGPAASQATTVTNTGTEALHIDALGISGSGSGFTRLTGGVGDCATGVLAAGGHCDVRVEFDPATTGPKAETLTVELQELPDVTVSLTGNGTQTTAAASPATLAFGKQDIDDGATAAKTGTITNTGTQPVTINGASVTGSGFAKGASNCVASTVLNAGETCTVDATFDPATVGDKTGAITVSSSVGDLVVGLTGTGTQTLLGVGPATLDFGNQDVDDGPTTFQTGTITNLGTEPVTLTGSSVTGADFSLLTGASGDCADAATLGAGDSCKLRLRFDPAETGVRNGTITVTSNAPDATIALTGMGIQTELKRDPTALDFGTQNVGAGPTAAQEATVTNAGTEPIALSGISLAGTDSPSFKLLHGEAGDCAAGVNLAAGATCNVRALFDPVSGGAKAAVAHVASNAGPDVTIALAGLATPLPKLTLPALKARASTTAGKRLKLPVKASSGTVRKVTVTVRSRSGKVLGSAKLTSLSGKRTVSLRLGRALAVGRYVSVAQGKDRYGNVIKGRGRITLIADPQPHKPSRGGNGGGGGSGGGGNGGGGGGGGAGGGGG